MYANDKTPADPFLAALARNPFNVDALIGLARLRTSAHHAAPTVLRSISIVKNLYFHAICFDVLAAILEDHDGDDACEAVALLAQAIEDPAYFHMRGKIARTLLKIGFAARAAIPELARTLRRGARESVSFPVKGAVLWLAWECWLHESANAQQCTFVALRGFSRSQRSWILDRMLENNAGGREVRAEALRWRDEMKAAIAADEANARREP